MTDPKASAADADTDGARRSGPGSTVWILGGLALILLAFVALRFIGSNDDDAATSDTASESPAPSSSIEGSLGPNGIEPGSVLFVDRSGAEGAAGRVTVLRPDGARLLLNRRCLRLAAAATTGICLDAAGPTLPDDYTVTFFDPTTPDLAVGDEQLAVFPGRAAVSPDGSLVSTSTWVIDVGYRPLNERRTAASIDIVGDDLGPIPLESWTTLPTSEVHSDPQARFWTVTFGPDNDTFWVAGLFGGAPEILRGTVSERFLEPIGLPGSEPSISPDGDTLVFVGLDGTLMAHDLNSGETRSLQEPGPIEDQVVFVDDDTVLYAKADGSRPADEVRVEQNSADTFTVWSLSLVGDSAPQVFAEGADAVTIYRG